MFAALANGFELGSAAIPEWAKEIREETYPTYINSISGHGQTISETLGFYPQLSLQAKQNFMTQKCLNFVAATISLLE
jgi:hypothetical protein